MCEGWWVQTKQCNIIMQQCYTAMRCFTMTCQTNTPIPTSSSSDSSSSSSSSWSDSSSSSALACFPLRCGGAEIFKDHVAFILTLQFGFILIGHLAFILALQFGIVLIVHLAFILPLQFGFILIVHTQDTFVGDWGVGSVRTPICWAECTSNSAMDN